MKYEVSLEGWKAGVVMLCAFVGFLDLFIICPTVVGIAIYSHFH